MLRCTSNMGLDLLMTCLSMNFSEIFEELMSIMAMTVQVPADSNASIQSLLTPEEAKAKAQELV